LPSLADYCTHVGKEIFLCTGATYYTPVPNNIFIFAYMHRRENICTGAFKTTKIILYAPARKILAPVQDHKKQEKYIPRRRSQFTKHAPVHVEYTPAPNQSTFL
jgi:hypothetical protein